MRGRAVVVSYNTFLKGITPAYAGKRAKYSPVIGTEKDHPRVCGEERPKIYHNFGTKGSPPRMRGRVAVDWQKPRDTGITPAYAGKSFPLALNSLHLEDHPRVCGEESLRTMQESAKEGSPPRMRGRGFRRSYDAFKHRITPAYAGKRIRPEEAGDRGQDHPRVCGEEGFRIPPECETWGSPPRMRGRENNTLSRDRVNRITPAYAGKSPIQLFFPLPCWDHPRVCGEERWQWPAGQVPVGSPPRMRGRALGCLPRYRLIGITPAYAGKSQPQGVSVAKGWDHPRVCGEEIGRKARSTVLWGSPPRMRGRVPLASCRCWGLRITPAYAGKRCF